MSNRKQTILIVDDISENINILDGILNKQYNVKAATNANMALKVANSLNPPDLILLDIMMPDVDGYMLCKLLKKNPRTYRIPIIFVSAKNEVIDEYKGLNIGAVDYITKPVHPQIVKARVKTHLALYDQNKNLATKVKIKTKEVLKTRLEIIHRLGRAAEYKDNETGMHVIRMSKYCHLIALSYGLIKDEADLYLNTAPMHDIGKIGIPDKILLKPGKLNKSEWEIMKSHTVIGAEIIGDHPSIILKQAKVAAISHHEKWNGTGYPKGLEGEQIPLVGRIIAVSDVFDALTSIRPYKEAWSAEDAVELIKNEKGKHFQKEIVDAFLNCLPEILKVKEKYKDNY